MLALLTVVVLICILISGTTKSVPCGEKAQSSSVLKHNDRSKIFSDLNISELQAVENYLKGQTGLNLVQVALANPSDNYIYLIELHLPKKKEALHYLDGEGPQPVREARAVVVFGALQPPNVTEYVVGPLPNPTYHKDVTLEKYNPIHFNARPVIVNEYKQISRTLNDELAKAPRTMNEVFGPQWRNLISITAGPRGFSSGDRISWFVIFQNVSGFFLHPVGLEVLVDHSSLTVSEWSVKKVFYCGQYFDNMSEVEIGHIHGKLPPNKFKHVHSDEQNYASLKPTVKVMGLAPLQIPLDNQRYSVRGNHVRYYHWSFSFGVGLMSGLRLFDVRFNGERIAYELSVQDAIAVYGSNTPASTMNRYIDGSHGLGRLSHQLVRGVDCPYLATYVDTEANVDPFSFQKTRDSICIFEYNTGIPLRRHFSDISIFNYGGLATSVLVIRTTSTVGNYDYIWDVIFHHNGAIKVQGHPTGYISTAYFYGDNAKYGHRVGETSLGVIHTHSIHFKADLDVGGTSNTLVGEDIEFEAVTIPWDTKQHLNGPKLVKTVVKTENEAAYRLQDKMPRYLTVKSDKTNKWGEARSYRIQVISFAGEHLPESSAEEKGISWARYKVAVTKHKDKEQSSSSLYNQNDPWSPAVNFANFIDNETIVNEDLVAWISAGLLHIPHAEDIPNTVTVGNGIGFYLRPFNYFDEDPSIESQDSVYIEKGKDPASCETNPVACLSKTASCTPHLPPFTYEGFDETIDIM